tara:strand:+ start:659 stop:961 length:303 start_codon:yes stop_codon:yes gene_type:complete
MPQIKSGTNNRTDVSSRNVPDFKNTGRYNSSTKVAANQTVAFTGSSIAAGFIVENVSNVSIELQNGGMIPGSALLVDTQYDIAPRKVIIGSSGIVHVLHK